MSAQALVGVMRYGNCTQFEEDQLKKAVAVLVEITGTQYSPPGFRYPAYEACLASASFVENGSWSGTQIATQLRMNTVTGIWCWDIDPSYANAFAYEKPNNGEEVYFGKSGLATMSPLRIASIIGHELMHNRGFTHSQNDVGSRFFPNTVPEQVEACILNGAPNPMPLAPVNPNARGDDLALFGGQTWSSLFSALSNDDGSFAVTNTFLFDFGVMASSPGVRALRGDFNGDGRMDIALTGGAGWSTIPVAMSLGDGLFDVTQAPVGAFGGWSSTPGVTALTGDFNKDGRTDIALTGGAGWGSIPVAFSIGGGSFSVTNVGAGSFGAWASTSGAKALAGDFNRDGYTDIALTGGAGWSAIRVASSAGDGSFNISSGNVGAFSAWSSVAGAKALTGDFNKDGYTDIALTGGAGWTSIPVAFGASGASFVVTNNTNVGDFGGWASTPGARALTGDFNKDGYTDIALTGGAGWRSIPVAFSQGGGAFSVTNGNVSAFGGWSATPGARAIAGDFNGDGYTDIALTGGTGWASIPVAFNAGGGNFNVTNTFVPIFPGKASDSAASVLAGPLN